MKRSLAVARSFVVDTGPALSAAGWGDEGPTRMYVPAPDSVESIAASRDLVAAERGGNTVVRTPQFVEDSSPQPRKDVAASRVSEGEAQGSTVALVVSGWYLHGADDGVGRIISLGESFIITRTTSSMFRDDPYVDVEHGALTFRPDGVVIDDFDSTNGVFTRITGTHPLRDGDDFRAGQQLLRFVTLKHRDTRGRAPALGSPEPGYWSRIDVMLAQHVSAASYPVDAFEMTIGRVAGELQFPDDPFLTSQHCRVSRWGRQVTLEDLGSVHGTWIRLRSGDVVPYGATLMIGRTCVQIERA